MSKKRKQPEHLSTATKVSEFAYGNSVMFVDPGSEGTGWAFFKNISSSEAPHATGVLRSNAKSWRLRIDTIAEDFVCVWKQHDPNWLVIEWPEVWSGSAKSQAAAASGALLQLAALCGALAESIHHIEGSQMGVLLITPHEWKGQLTKPAVNARIKRAIGEAYPNHVSDAVGMGLAVMGVL